MKKYVFILAIFMAFSCSSDDSTSDNEPTPPATTTIADSNFEQALIDLGLDDELDGRVLNSNIESIMNLIIDNKNITNLSGLQGFTNLYTLSANGNAINSINVTTNSKLKFIYLDNNDLSGINVQGLSMLEKLSLNNNMISSINVSGISTLQQLMINGNGVSQLDVSTNTELTVLDTRNSNITCINVSDNQLNNIPNGWVIDNTTSYSTDCN